MDNRSPAYRGVVLALLAASVVGTLAVAAAGYASGVAALLDAAVALAIASAVLVSVSSALRARGAPPPPERAAPPTPSARRDRPFVFLIDGPNWVLDRFVSSRGRIAALGAFLLLVTRTPPQRIYLVEHWKAEEYVSQFNWPDMGEFQSYLVVPLLAENRSLGIVQVFVTGS